MPDRPVLALLDGHSLAFRAFYALPEDLRTTTGQVTNAVYGFTSMLIKLLGEHRPDGIGVVFDMGRPAERMQLLPTYKAQREAAPDDFHSQMPLIREVIDALAIPRVAVEGCEGDDVIATYARHAVAAGWDVLAVSGDRDVFQLVDDNVKVLYTRRGISDTVVMDHDAVVERYGVPPARYAMLAALRGDSSDNIDGVPGVGDKTAAKLLTEFGDLDGVFANLDKVRGKKLPATLAEHREEVLKSHQVVTLMRDLPVPTPVDELRMGRVDREALQRLFATLEFRSLWDRLNEQVLDANQEATAGGFAAEPVRAAAGALAAHLRDIGSDVPVAVVPFTQGRLPDLDLVAVTLAWSGTAPLYVELQGLTAEDGDALSQLLADEDRPLLVADLKALLHGARRRGLTVDGVVFAVELAAYLVAPQQRAYDLATLALQYLHKHLVTAGEAAPDGDGQLTMDVEAERDDEWVAQGLQAAALADLHPLLDAELDERRQGPLLADLELPLVAVLARMEEAGIAVDAAVFHEMSDELGDRIRDRREEVFVHAGREFNLDSPKQLQVVLFEELGLQRTKRTKTGWSTDAGELTKLLDDHPVVAPLLEYRELSKLKGTYVDALPPLINPATGRIHPEYLQTVAATGRLSSQNPNIQNIPVRSEQGRLIRRAFVPGEGYTSLLVADYSQIELRVMAHLTGDEGLREAFSSGEDIHATTAARVFDLPLDAIDGMLRDRVKFITYGLAYGLSAYGLAQQLRIPPDEARELMDAYFARFPKVRDFLRGVVGQARRDGYTSTLLGRRRYLPDLTSDQRQRREMAERMALNAPIQGTAADLIKLAMIRVDARMRAEGLSSQLLLQVHDELVCETAAGEEEQLRALVVEEMAGVADLAVPLEVDTASGASWAQAQKH